MYAFHVSSDIDELLSPGADLAHNDDPDDGSSAEAEQKKRRVALALQAASDAVPHLPMWFWHSGYKLKLSKKQKSTTIEPQNPVLAQNPPKTAPSSGYSAIQLNRQMDYSSKQGHAAKYLQQNRTSQQNQLHLDK